MSRAEAMYAAVLQAAIDGDRQAASKAELVQFMLGLELGMELVQTPEGREYSAALATLWGSDQAAHELALAEGVALIRLAIRGVR